MHRRSYVQDTETTLYYLQSRYYDPEIGRFINADAYASTGQGILGNNMFAYCGNNPIFRIDLTGTSFQTAFFPTCIDPGTGKRYDYVIYYYHPDSSMNFDHPVTRNHVPSEATYCPAGSFDELINALTNTPKNTDDIYIYLHSDENNLSFYFGKYFDANDIQQHLSEVDISGNIYLFACRSGRGTLASTMAKATNCNVVACVYKVSFGLECARYGYKDYWIYSRGYDDYAWYIFTPDGNKFPYSHFKIPTR